MSNHGSNGTNDEEVGVDNSEIGKPEPEPYDNPRENAGAKGPIAPANFGRPRKHPYKPGKYKCDYCDVMCAKPSVLKKHLRAHTNERPYPCSLCKRSFKTKSNLSKHMKSKSHSSKLAPSTKEKASLMLQAISEAEPFKSIAVSMDNIEYDCVEKEATTENSPATSYDEHSVASEDNSTVDSLKKADVSEHSQDHHKEDEPDNELSSCSGMLTINSQSGPITVEVEIKLETMKQLQHGLSNMTFKKCSPSPINSTLSLSSCAVQRNDADVRAAESILHMANQRHSNMCPVTIENKVSPVSVEPKLMLPKEEFRRSDPVELPRSVVLPTPRIQEVAQSPVKPGKVTTLSYTPRSIGRSRMSGKCMQSEDQKKMKKCLMENLLKKMQRKVDRTQKLAEICSNAGNHAYFSSNSTTESEPDSTQTNFKPITSIQKQQQKKTPTNNSNPTPFKLSTVTPEFKMQNFVSVSSSSSKQTMFLQRNSPITSHVSNSPTTLPSNSAIYLLSSYQDSKRLGSPISSTGFKVDSTSDVMPKVINNIQRVYQTPMTGGINPMPVLPSPSVVTPLLHSIKEESIVKQRLELGSPENMMRPNNAEIPTQTEPQSSDTASQGSEGGSSPRLCIVEDTMDTDASMDNKKSQESDEEIDVVNNDSDIEDNDSTIKRLTDQSGVLSGQKKRKGERDCESDLMEMESKKLKEMEKPVTLHAPNINAKDLVQDCPLNLSANRQPIIPSCPPSPQITGSVLENIYRPKAAMVNTASSAESNIASLTNTHPAHPHSLRDTQIIDVSIPSNGHHLEYPIFEDKVRCEVCSQMIEPKRLQLHKSTHIYTDGKDAQSPSNASSKSGAGGPGGPDSTVSKQAFNKPRTYRCVVCNIGFRVMGHLSKHHKSKSHLQGLVNSGLLSKALNAKIEESKLPIAEVIDQKTGNIIPDVLSKYLSDWSQPTPDTDTTGS